MSEREPVAASALERNPAPEASVPLQRSVPWLRYLELVLELARRNFSARYRNGVLGVAGVFLVPLLYLGTYTFVFSTLVPVRPWSGASRSDYAFFLFSGLLAWNLVAEAVGAAPNMFRERSNYLLRAQFPPSALPLSAVLAAYYQSLVWLAVFAGVRTAIGLWPGPWFLAAPLVLAFVAAVATGLALAVCALGALMRDLSQLVAPALSLGAFLSPVFYPAESISAVAPWLVAFNPLAPALLALRDLLLHRRALDPTCVAQMGLWALASVALGWILHRRIARLLPDLV